MSGTLFVVATPIGNLEDISFRALRTLREVDLIAAEDTRRTLKLLTHYEIRKPLVSLHEHNEYREGPRLVARMARGENVALVSDAGTPGIADPGARLVRSAREAGLSTVPIPGPSAVTAALSVAGFDASEFVFMGFAPAKGADRGRWLERLRDEDRLTVFFEAPHRVASTVTDVGLICGVRPIVILREISKINFELVEYDKNKPATIDKPLGEFAIVIGPRSEEALSDGISASAYTIFGYLTEQCAVSDSKARAAIAMALCVRRADVERAVRAGRKLAKQQRMAGS